MTGTAADRAVLRVGPMPCRSAPDRPIS